MHDMLEGVCVYVIRAILYAFIFQKKYFTLEELNMRIKQFSVSSEDSNKPPAITKNEKKEKLNLKYSASEMLYLTRYLGLIIGDLIPLNDEHWKMYILLRKIVDILICPQMTLSQIRDLVRLILDLNSAYIRFYETLKPKFHFLIHYARILLLFGPCVHFWCMRFESRHRDIRASAQGTSSKINLLFTVALKQVLKMCEFLNNNQCEDDVVFDSKSSLGNGKYSSVMIHATKYELGTFIVLDVSEPDIKFGKIIKIERNTETVKFTVEVFEELYFDSHTMSYIIDINPDTISTAILSEISIMPPVSVIKRQKHVSFHVIAHSF